MVGAAVMGASKMALNGTTREEIGAAIASYLDLEPQTLSKVRARIGR